MTTAYGIIANCNYETGDPVLAATRAVESGLTDDADLVAALDALEETLGEYACNEYAHAKESCRKAERAVLAAWTTEVQASVDEARFARRRD